MWALCLGVATPKRYRNVCPAAVMPSTSPYSYGCSEMESVIWNGWNYYPQNNGVEKEWINISRENRCAIYRALRLLVGYGLGGLISPLMKEKECLILNKGCVG